jgi:hypothetical protein
MPCGQPHLQVHPPNDWPHFIAPNFFITLSQSAEYDCSGIRERCHAAGRYFLREGTTGRTLYRFHAHLFALRPSARLCFLGIETSAFAQARDAVRPAGCSSPAGRLHLIRDMALSSGYDRPRPGCPLGGSGAAGDPIGRRANQRKALSWLPHSHNRPTTPPAVATSALAMSAAAFFPFREVAELPSDLIQVCRNSGVFYHRC